MQLDDALYDIMKLGHRPNTRRNLRSQRSIYNKFCEEHGYQEFPADEWQLMRYAVYTSQRVTAQGTVSNYVSGVRSLQELAGYVTPSASAKNLDILMDGLKEQLSSSPRKADVMTVDILKQISDKVDYSNQFEICCFTAVLLGFLSYAAQE